MHHGCMFASLLNFRDLSTADPVRVRAGRVFRSDNLSRLDDGDRRRFAALGVRTVLDLRTPGEVGSYGRFDHGGVGYHNVSVLKTDWEANPYRDGVLVSRYLADRYLDLTVEGAAEIAAVVRLLASPEVAPAVVHCAAGRDRTGVVSAVVLALLGVPDEAIGADYARSGQSTQRATALLGLPVPPPEYATTPAEAMLLVLAGLREQHGSVARYAESIGVTGAVVAALRAQLSLTG